METGVIAYLEGNGSHTIAYRADIDALPILEENDVPYRSQSDHVMHACGHDGHTTALMLFVQRCKDTQDAGQLPQNVVFIFQPAEETGGGANRLIKPVPLISIQLKRYLVFMLTHLLMKALQ